MWLLYISRGVLDFLINRTIFLQTAEGSVGLVFVVVVVILGQTSLSFSLFLCFIISQEENFPEKRVCKFWFDDC